MIRTQDVIALDTWFIVGSFLQHTDYLNLRLAISGFANNDQDPIRGIVNRSIKRKDKYFSIVKIAWYHDKLALNYFISKDWEIDIILYQHCIKLGRRIERLEPYIFTSPEMAYLYAVDVVEGRIKEVEDLIALRPRYTYKYMRNVLTNEEIDEFIKEGKHRAVCDSAKYLYKSLFNIRRNMVTPQTAIRYMRKHLEVKYMYLLCMNILYARCPDLEGLIITHPWYSYFYIKHLVGTRLPEAEKYMLMSQSMTQMYVENVVLTQTGPLKRWKEAESHIRHNLNLGIKYYRRLITQWAKERIRLARRRNG